MFLISVFTFQSAKSGLREGNSQQLSQTSNLSYSNYHDNFDIIKFDNPTGFQAWIQGILFILFLYHFLLYFQNRNLMFLYYSAFVFCLLVYFMHHGPKMFYLTKIPSRTVPLFYGIQFLGYFFYISYIREVAQTKQVIPKWDKTLLISRKVLLFFVLTICTLNYFFDSNQIYILVLVVFFLLTIFAIINYFIFYRIKGIPIKLLIIGSIAYLVMANISLFHNTIFILYNQRLPYDPILFMEIGAVTESLLFALVIGYRINAIEKEKNIVQVQLLQKSIEASNLKIVALKAQMNPHFIFNALNSINNYILKNNKEEASDYLTKFSKLIRKILKNSSETAITLREEIEILRTYIKLEQLRVDGGFGFTLHNHQIDLDALTVPPLFLQPYVENAIWHGLSHKEGVKKLEISIHSNNETNTYIKIKDNGIGREASSRITSKLNRRSFGTRITEERINSIDKTAKVTIEDILDTTHKVCGTLVTISIN